MALIRPLGKKYNSTTIYTSSATTQSSGNITLTNSISNYDYLKFTFIGNSSSQDECSIICDVEKFKQLVNSETNYDFAGLQSPCTRYSSATYTRQIHYVDDTTILLGACRQAHGSGENNTLGLLTKIEGIV